jgi:PTS system mannitol-specific IIA component
VTGVLSKELIVAAGTARTMSEAIREAGELLVRAGAVDAEYIDSMEERERTMSTYMGNFLAIPHGTNESKGSIHRSALSLVRYPDPIDWGGRGDVHIVIGIAGVENEHLEMLSKVAVVFSDEEDAARMRDATTVDELYDVLESVND